MNNKICVYAICKNEARFVDKWFESMSEADYICVLDTGSTDNTYNKLLEHLYKSPNKVIIKQQNITPWRFDMARNASLELVPEDANILICTDLDEILEQGWAQPLRDKWIEGVHERAVYKYAWSHDEFGNPGRIFYYDKIHSKHWKWKYPVHELLSNELTNSNAYFQDNTLDLFNEVYLHHYPDKSKSRASYLPLLELREQENNEDYYGLIYLSHEYTYQGLYQKAIDKLKFILNKYKDTISQLDEASCYLFMGDSYKQLGLLGEAIRCYNLAMEKEPSYREPYLGLANILVADGKYEEAYQILQVALDKTWRHYTWLERDTSWTYELFDVMSLAAYYSGHKIESLAFAIKASDTCPNNDRLKQNIKLILQNMEDKDFLVKK